MQIQEFLMPTAVKDIGTISVTTWDFRDGQNRPIDLFEYSGLQSRSGAIVKISEVSVTSNETGAVDQTYTFNF